MKESRTGQLIQFSDNVLGPYDVNVNILFHVIFFSLCNVEENSLKKFSNHNVMSDYE